MAKNKDKNKNKSLEDALEVTDAPATVPAKETDVPDPTQASATSETTTEKEQVREVTDAKGRVMFRRKLGTAAANLHVKPNETVKTKKTKRFETGSNQANPVNLKFPADPWGVTKDLKVAFIGVASRVAGDERKRDLVMETLAILARHFEEKFEKDNEYRKQRATEAKERAEAEAEARAEAEQATADGQVPEVQ